MKEVAHQNFNLSTKFFIVAEIGGEPNLLLNLKSNLSFIKVDITKLQHSLKAMVERYTSIFAKLKSNLDNISGMFAT